MRLDVDAEPVDAVDSLLQLVGLSTQQSHRMMSATGSQRRMNSAATPETSSAPFNTARVTYLRILSQNYTLNIAVDFCKI